MSLMLTFVSFNLHEQVTDSFSETVNVHKIIQKIVAKQI